MNSRGVESSMEPTDFDYQLQAEKEYSGSEGVQQRTAGGTYTDPRDGTVYEWDAQKQGWFPKVV